MKITEEELLEMQQRIKKGSKKYEPEIVPTEYQEAKILASWCRANSINHWHIPNENTINNPAFTNKLKLMGWNKGIADYFIVIPANKQSSGQTVGLFIELKRRKPIGKNGKPNKSPSKVDPAQIGFVAITKMIDGIDSIIAYGSGEAIEFIKKYLR